MKYFFALVIILLCNATEVRAQTSEVADTITVRMKSDSIYTGTLINITKDSIIINNEDNGLMSFNKSEIKTFLDGALKKRFKGTPTLSVPFFVQTAKPNGKGRHYYKNYFLFGNELNYGVSDNLNFSIGFETASLIIGRGRHGLPIMQAGAKYGTSSSRDVNLAISTKYYISDDISTLFIASPITFGGGRTNFTISPNYISSTNDRQFAILSNLSLSLTYNSRLIIDFGRVDGENPLAILLEHVFKNGFTLSAGGYIVDGSAIPNLSFSVPFGNWKK